MQTIEKYQLSIIIDPELELVIENFYIDDDDINFWINTNRNYIKRLIEKFCLDERINSHSLLRFENLDGDETYLIGEWLGSSVIFHL